jgi:branched-chain amino acid transport system substrate-binding protein
MASYTSDTILLIKTFKELNFNPKLIIGQRGGFMVSEFFTALGKDAEYLMTTSAWNADLANPVIKQVGDLYLSRSGGIPMTGDITRDVNNILLIAMGVNQAKSTDSEKLREALTKLEYPKDQMLLPWSGIALDENNQNTQANGIIVQVQGGKYNTVYPTALKATDVIFPIPAWNERK